MKLVWKIAVPATCAALICAGAVSWHLIKARAAQRSLVEKVEACRVRAEQGDPKAQSELASRYYYGKGLPQDYAAAAAWDRKAADHGYAAAQCDLAYLYQEGKGVQQDRRQAIELYRKAADQGYAKAQYALGYSYYQGWEVPQDYGEAVRWYRKAADQGYAKAQSDLGYMYAIGKGVSQDYGEAVSWSRKAADQGNARAESALGYAYSEGKGVPRDYTQSARWYRKAAKQGDDYARRALGEMNPRLSPFSNIVLAVVFLWSVFLLIGSRGGMREGPRRRFTLAGLLGLVWVGLDLYAQFNFGILLSLSAVGVFFALKGLAAGISMAIVLSPARPQGFRATLGLCGALFVAFNVFASRHYDLRYLSECSPAFFSINALFIGMTITFAILLWSAGQEASGNQNGTDALGSATEALPR